MSLSWRRIPEINSDKSDEEIWEAIGVLAWAFVLDATFPTMVQLNVRGSPRRFDPEEMAGAGATNGSGRWTAPSATD